MPGCIRAVYVICRRACNLAVYTCMSVLHRIGKVAGRRISRSDAVSPSQMRRQLQQQLAQQMWPSQGHLAAL